MGGGEPFGENWGGGSGRWKPQRERRHYSLPCPGGWGVGGGVPDRCLPCDLFDGLSLLTHTGPSPQT